MTKRQPSPLDLIPEPLKQSFLEAASIRGLSIEEFFKVCLGRGIAAEVRDLNGIIYFEATKKTGSDPGYEPGHEG